MLFADCSWIQLPLIEGRVEKEEVAVELTTSPHSKERLEALPKTITHDSVLAVIGGDNFTSDNMFKAIKLPANRAMIEELKKEKKER